VTREEFELAARVSRETSAAFDKWRELLVETSAHTNLVGRSTLADFWERHAMDSFQLFEMIPEHAQRIIDLGSGAGFPGLALALGLKDRNREGHVVMVDSVGKKMAFLRSVIAATGAPAEARTIRVEEINSAETFDVVTARAFAPLHKLLEYAHPFMKNGALGLFMKGRHYQDELTEARKHWTFEAKVIPSSTSDGVIISIDEVRRVR
jgi:16S rRNA (guanine527-N7)-methyltransferase